VDFANMLVWVVALNLARHSMRVRTRRPIALPLWASVQSKSVGSPEGGRRFGAFASVAENR
jgi:hypothetical protein